MKTIVVAVLVAAGMALSGCNTVKGIGKDVQKGGQAIEKAADK
ncbi:entericidin A/B family lipoprotein [Pseudothauera nasutitermitis]|uniref:Entericidin A/B family lipoprotein n=1 Tax=Pseudothauera nasutitermitis TaxID=2565930 RepID=A0A4S4B762_9RHOO|nr:entericidin A/B family lipoprotein [Pseudothauera nasutitermitis]THF66853.1 entericidin A/B family lipoprotein [Pseudothauera nasutitermitis]